jgi:hypothetical protein
MPSVSNSGARCAFQLGSRRMRSFVSIAADYRREKRDGCS